MADFPAIALTTLPPEVLGLEDSLPAIEVFSTGGAAAVVYKMRGRDDGVPAPGYVSWNSDFPDFLGVNSGGSVPPIVGSLIPGSVVEVSSWTE